LQAVYPPLGGPCDHGVPGGLRCPTCGPVYLGSGGVR
jgi:hypothetical protein